MRRFRITPRASKSLLGRLETRCQLVAVGEQFLEPAPYGETTIE